MFPKMEITSQTKRRFSVRFKSIGPGVYPALCLISSAISAETPAFMLRQSTGGKGDYDAVEVMFDFGKNRVLVFSGGGITSE